MISCKKAVLHILLFCSFFSAIPAEQAPSLPPKHLIAVDLQSRDFDLCLVRITNNSDQSIIYNPALISNATSSDFSRYRKKWIRMKVCVGMLGSLLIGFNFLMYEGYCLKIKSHEVWMGLLKSQLKRIEKNIAGLECDARQDLINPSTGKTFGDRYQRLRKLAISDINAMRKPHFFPELLSAGITTFVLSFILYSTQAKSLNPFKNIVTKKTVIKPGASLQVLINKKNILDDTASLVYQALGYQNI